MPSPPGSKGRFDRALSYDMSIFSSTSTANNDSKHNSRNEPRYRDRFNSIFSSTASRYTDEPPSKQPPITYAAPSDPSDPSNSFSAGTGLSSGDDWLNDSAGWKDDLEEGEKQGFFRRQIDSFKRDPNRSFKRGLMGADSRYFDEEAAAKNTAESPLLRRLKGRHLQMIAIGGSIGTGLFVGSGAALANGGPASLLITFSVVGIMLYCTVHALGELAVAFPVAGSFSAYSTRFLDPAWGFAMGWNYAMQWLVTLPLEIVSASITLQYWGDGVSQIVWVTLFLLLIVLINLFGVKGYGEAEFIFSIVKIVAVVGFIVLGCVLNVGGGPGASYIGGTYWRDPGAFNNGFRGLCTVFVLASFAYAGTELVGLAAAETTNPRKTLPKAIKQVFWRIALFYIVSLLLVGLLVPYTNLQLLTGGSDDVSSSASPFVIAITSAGIQGLDSVMNVVILIAVLSVGNASVYGSSRTLAALGEQGQAPKIFAYIDRNGRPLVSIIAATSIGLLAYLSASEYQEVAFEWLIAISGLSSVLTWASICLAHIRFRRAWKVQGHSLEELAFLSQPGLYGSWLGLIINILILAAQFWTGFAPIGYDQNTVDENVMNFFQGFLAVPIVLVFYFAYKFWFKTKIMRSTEMDLHTGIREIDVLGLLRAERRERKEWPAWKRLYNYLC